MYKTKIKVIIDYLLAFFLLPLLFVVIIVVGIIIKLEDKGPIFYSGERIGKNSKIFKMYKFRSMKIDSPNLLNKNGSTFNSKYDQRVTKVGKVLRRTSIDELPQVLNVLKGEMSFVGPRASLSMVLSTYREDELDKMKVLPGITGFTQAYYRNSLSTREKRLKDAWYANNISLFLDFKIVLKTVSTVLLGSNQYTNFDDFKENK